MLSNQNLQHMTLLIVVCLVSSVAAQGSSSFLDTILSFAQPVTEAYQRAATECGADAGLTCTITTTVREVALTLFNCFLTDGGCPVALPEGE